MGAAPNGSSFRCLGFSKSWNLEAVARSLTPEARRLGLRPSHLTSQYFLSPRLLNVRTVFSGNKDRERLVSRRGPELRVKVIVDLQLALLDRRLPGRLNPNDVHTLGWAQVLWLREMFHRQLHDSVAIFVVSQVGCGLCRGYRRCRRQRHMLCATDQKSKTAQDCDQADFACEVAGHTRWMNPPHRGCPASAAQVSYPKQLSIRYFAPLASFRYSALSVPLPFATGNSVG